MEEKKIEKETSNENVHEKKEDPIAENKMGTVPVKKLLLSMAWPAILSMTINALYNIVDSIFAVSYTHLHPEQDQAGHKRQRPVAARKVGR